MRDRLCPQTFQTQRSEILSPEAQSPYNRKKTNLKDWAGMLPTAQLMCGLRPVMSKRRPCLSCAAIRGSQVQGCRLEFDINCCWLGQRTADLTRLYRMDRSGCLRNSGHRLMPLHFRAFCTCRLLAASLASNYFAEPIDLMFVFEINALMPCPQMSFWYTDELFAILKLCVTAVRHPMTRVMPARRVLLYPTCSSQLLQSMPINWLNVTVQALQV